MTTEHDEALVERVALAFYTERGFTRKSFYALPNKSHWIEAARAVIYPPAPPNTRLQVARELLAAAWDADNASKARRVRAQHYDDAPEMQAVLSALDAHMED